jgi:hypothetical protein
MAAVQNDSLSFDQMAIASELSEAGILRFGVEVDTTKES